LFEKYVEYKVIEQKKKKPSLYGKQMEDQLIP
jgi:hypothetical protein